MSDNELRLYAECLLAAAGHAINANAGRCPLIEDVLLRTTTLCVAVLDREKPDEVKEDPCP